MPLFLDASFEGVAAKKVEVEMEHCCAEKTISESSSKYKLFAKMMKGCLA